MLDLIQPVGDEDDRHSLRLEAGDDTISRSVSASGRLEVGSSRMTTRASTESALAISTIAVAQVTGRRRDLGLKLAPSRSVAARRAPDASVDDKRIQPQHSGSRPIKTFPATSRLSNRLSSWCTKAMPAPSCPQPRAQCGRRRRSRSSPPSGAITPPKIFIRVDLPAPFSPMSAITSPRYTAAWKGRGPRIALGTSVSGRRAPATVGPKGRISTSHDRRTGGARRI